MANLSWSYGVTTVPERRTTTLPRTLESLERAGFPAPWLFIDGCVDVFPYKEQFPHLCHLSVRRDRKKAYGNWILSLWELYLKNPEADRYALFQDDVIFSTNVRAYLDHLTYPGDPPRGRPIPLGSPTSPLCSSPKGYWNLYIYPIDIGISFTQGLGWYRSNQRGRGALALVFSNACVMEILSAPHMVQRLHTPSSKDSCIDGAVISAMSKAGYCEYIHYPSLVEHIGTVSTIAKDHTGVPRTYSFEGEKFDALSLLTHPKRMKPL